MKDRQHLNKYLVLFFDFYTINELYLRCGGFREIGYSQYNVFVPEKIFETIKYQYEYIVELMFDHTVKCLARTVRAELIKHFYCEARDKKEYDYMTRDKLLEYEGYTLKIFYRNGIIEHADKAYILYSNYIWSDNYGGMPWANAAKALSELKNVKTISDKVYWVDKVMDLHHNSGHILNKTEFRCLSLHVKENVFDGKFFGNYLDFRAECKTIFDMLVFCSSKVRNLIIPRKQILI